MSMAVPYAGSNALASSYSAPPRPTTTGSAATAIRARTLATALLAARDAGVLVGGGGEDGRRQRRDQQGTGRDQTGVTPGRMSSQ